MALALKDRVKETTTTAGTGTVTLAGAAAGFQSFAAVGDGNQTFYAIVDATTGDWEVGVGTYTASGTTLSRTTVVSSSNAGSLVPFGAGSKDVFVTYPSSRAVYLDAAGSAVTTLDIGTLGTSTANITTANITSGTITTPPTNNTDIVNKEYADAIASGIHFHEAVGYATTAALPAVTYSNGTGGVGATLTANANGALTVDGYTFTSPADNGTRILIKNQANGAENGVYTLTQAGNSSPGAPFILTRSTDMDSVGTGVDQIDEGDFFLVTSGTANVNTAWVQQTPPPITIGTTAIVFQQFSAPITYTAGTGLSESPSYTFNIANIGTAGTYGSASSVPVITTNAQGQVTGVTPTAIAISGAAVTGNISGSAGSVANALTAGTFLTSGGTFDGSAARTFAVDATDANTASKVVARDASGNFSAGTITATLSGAATSATTATNLAGGAANRIAFQTGAGATSFAVAPSASNQVLNWNGSAFTWSAGTISGIPLGSNLNTLTFGTFLTGTSYNGSSAVTIATNATNANTASTIVARDASGNFSAGTITAALSGNATTATTATNQSGGTVSATSIAYSTTLTGGTGIINIGSGQFYKDASGNVGIGTAAPAQRLDVTGASNSVQARFGNVAGRGLEISTTLTGGTNDATSVLNARGAASGNLVLQTDSVERLRINQSGAVSFGSSGTNTGTSGQLLQSGGSGASPSWITATNANTASTIVARDASGNFSAGTITAALSGNATTATTATNQSGGTVSATTGTFSGAVGFNGSVTFSGGVGGSEGGEVTFAKPASGTNFLGNIANDINGDAMRWFANYAGTTKVFSLNFAAADGVLLSSGNYNSYAPTLTGTGASGTWGINVTGNAATVTNGVYTTGAQSIAGVKTFSDNPIFSGGTIQVGSSAGTYRRFRFDGTISSDGTNFFPLVNSSNVGTYALPIAGGTMTGQITTRVTSGATPIVSGSGANTIQVMGDATNGAWFSLHRSGAYAVNFGMDTSNVVSLGGWSDGAQSRWTSDTAGNFVARGNVTYVKAVNVISGNTTAVTGQNYVFVASLTLTLPASPVAGNYVSVSNRSGTLTAVIARNGQNIMGLAENMTVDSLNAGFVLTFADATRGWVLAV
jgi:hypothetical protein